MIVSALNQDELDAIEDLKATNGIITTSLENDLLVLRKQHQNLTTDFEQQKSQLLEALLSKDRIMQDHALLKERTGTSENELIERAKARGTKEVELEEVSGVTKLPPPAPSAKKTKFLGRLSRLSLFRPYGSKNDQVVPVLNPRPKPTRETDEATRLALERAAVRSEAQHRAQLAHELAAIGRGPAIPVPQISPRFIQLPPSPIITHSQRHHVLRRRDRRVSN